MINKDNSITVIDNGRGVPVDINHKTGRPAIEVVYTVLHAGVNSVVEDIRCQEDFTVLVHQ